MRNLFWGLLSLNVGFAVAVCLSLPWGQDVIYAIMAGTQLGCLAILGRSRDRG